jgi:hypothetical protein
MSPRDFADELMAGVQDEMGKIADEDTLATKARAQTTWNALRDRWAGRDVATARQDVASVVEPVDVLEGGELDIVEAAPGSAAADQFGLVEAVVSSGVSP